MQGIPEELGFGLHMVFIPILYVSKWGTTGERVKATGYYSDFEYSASTFHRCKKCVTYWPSAFLGSTFPTATTRHLAESHQNIPSRNHHHNLILFLHGSLLVQLPLPHGPVSGTAQCSGWPGGSAPAGCLRLQSTGCSAKGEMVPVDRRAEGVAAREVPQLRK